MAKIQKLVFLICLVFIFSCDKNAELLKCSNTKDSFYDPSIEKYLGDSIVFFEFQTSNDLSFRLDDKLCRMDSCAYYIFNLSTFGCRNDSMMSLRYYARMKKWNPDDVIVKCDFVQILETSDNKSSGYFVFQSKGTCPILVKTQMDSCSYQNALLHVDSTIYFEREF